LPSTDFGCRTLDAGDRPCFLLCMTSPAPSPVPALVPGFLDAVDAEVARIDFLFSVAYAAFCHGMATAQAAAAQRPTERSARGVRAHAHRAGLPVIGGAQ
jgi:hypothetical protein